MAIRFTNILRDIILESSRFQVLFDKYVKPKERGQKGMMPLQVLFKIIAGDPTSKVPEGMTPENVTAEKMENVKIGKYTQWLLKHFVSPNIDLESGVTDPNSPAVKQAIKEWQDLFLEDLYKTTQDLMKYERNKNKLPQEYRDINKLTPQTLYDQVKDFSLEKTKASKEEKKEASQTYSHPGADNVTRLDNWTVVKITRTDDLGKDAACFYGGSHNEPSKGETRWCTSSPGLTYWKSYLSRGPLYVVIPNSPTPFKGFGKEVGDISGLPANRYQFHFQDKQFMDADDRQIDLVEFLKKNEDLKTYFKPEMMENILQGVDKNKATVDYPRDPASKFMVLYGTEEFISSLPKTISRLEIIAKGGELKFKFPSTLGELTNLTAIHLVGCVLSLPDSICNLQKLQFLSLPDNSELQRLPDCISELPRLSIINLKGSNKDALPESLQNISDDSPLHIFF
jgi:hypothetical protein